MSRKLVAGAFAKVPSHLTNFFTCHSGYVCVCVLLSNDSVFWAALSPPICTAMQRFALYECELPGTLFMLSSYSVAIWPQVAKLFNACHG